MKPMYFPLAVGWCLGHLGHSAIDKYELSFSHRGRAFSIFAASQSYQVFSLK